MAESLRLSVQMVILSEVRRVKIIHWGKKIDVSVPYGTPGARGTKSRVSTFCTLTPRAHRHFFPTNMFWLTRWPSLKRKDCWYHKSWSGLIVKSVRSVNLSSDDNPLFMYCFLLLSWVWFIAAVEPGKSPFCGSPSLSCVPVRFTSALQWGAVPWATSL